MTQTIELDIYTDGSWSSNNPSVVGWGVLVTEKGNLSNEFLRRNGQIVDPDLVKQRNAIGEVFGALVAAELVKSWGMKARLHYDYKGVECFITGEWRPKNGISVHYVETMRPMYKDGTVKFVKIDAHVDPGNIIVDQLAKDAVWGKLV